MYKNKEVRLIFSEEAERVYEELNKIVGEEKKNKIESSFHQTLLRSINRIKDLLKENPFAGDQIHKERMPEKYIRLYGSENVWRIELSDRWRLVYSVSGDKIEIITFVMDIFNHRDYDKVFGYKH
jgi:Txe/YoeB family toxin of Txe-Axe toxin-antitoxin module